MPTHAYKENLSDEVRKIYFLDVTKFSDLFSQWCWWEHHEKAQGFERIPVESEHSKDAYISDFCSAHNTDLDNSLHVKPTQILVDFIGSNMILPDYDSIYFELVGRKDGLLVIAKNNAILASRWLALLPKTELLEIRKNATTVYEEKTK